MFHGEVIDRRKEKAAAEAQAPEADPFQHIQGLAGGELPEAALAASGGQAMQTGCHAVVEFKNTVHGEVQAFKSVGYTLVYLAMNGQQMLAGRAGGLRTDDKVFTADWLFPPVWEEGLSWQAEAKKRLMTFKACACDREGRCKFHGEACPGRMTPGKWLEEDMKRLQGVSQTPLCEALEILMKAEMARSQSRIVAPGQ